MTIADKKNTESRLIEMRSISATPAKRMDACRRLLPDLNYSSKNSPLKVGLTGEAAKALKASPTLIAAGGEGDEFQVIHTQLAGANLLRTVERAVITALLPAHPYTLFIFSNADHSRWHFVNVKVARKEKSDENRDTRLRRLFRRISISVDDRLRTATERIAMLDLAAIHPELFGLSALPIQQRHDDAFDVEAVTSEFFKEYRRVFEAVEGAIKGLRGAENRRLYTQRLFNRLMFIAFIQKKGWLKFPGMAENEYLEALWKDYREKKKGDDPNFYRDRLSHLFFRGLNTPNDVNIVGANTGKVVGKPSFLAGLIGDVPYLNGGLFEKSDDGTDDDSSIVVPDKAIDAVINELFARFNFTVSESTPLDVEVAVDPEMLGKVFEELVTGRHESGSYYTPKPIVSFMCREALKGYLETKFPGERKDAIAAFVDEHTAVGLRDGEAVLDALRKVKVCDPACGSGA